MDNKVKIDNHVGMDNQVGMGEMDNQTGKGNQVGIDKMDNPVEVDEMDNQVGMDNQVEMDNQIGKSNQVGIDKMDNPVEIDEMDKPVGIVKMDNQIGKDNQVRRDEMDNAVGMDNQVEIDNQVEMDNQIEENNQVGIVNMDNQVGMDNQIGMDKMDMIWFLFMNECEQYTGPKEAASQYNDQVFLNAFSKYDTDLIVTWLRLGNSPLHIAVIEKNFEVFEHFLSKKKGFSNARNFSGETPLYMAAKEGNIEFAQILIDNGADVNLSDMCGNTPLHVSIDFPEISYLLIKNGADIDVLNLKGHTPLMDAVGSENCLETVYLLLYFNADANLSTVDGMTPFMRALETENCAAQYALLDYVTDFNASTDCGKSTLCWSLTDDNNPLSEEIVRRGGVVENSAYESCFIFPTPENFRLIWKNLPKGAEYVSLAHLYFLRTHNDEFLIQAYLDIILEDTDSSILSVLAENMHYHYMEFLIVRCSPYNSAREKLANMICLLLQYGYRITSEEIDTVFRHYGYCEFFRILLFMNYEAGWGYVITTRLIFDMQSTLETITHEIIQDNSWCTLHLIEAVISSFRYWAYLPLAKACLNKIDRAHFAEEYDEFSKLIEKRPKVPKLLELARNKVREHIVGSRNLTSACAYYTVINSMNMSSVYKKILMYEKELYDY